MNINSSTSSIYAHQDLLSSSAHNIANSNTDGFDRVDTNIVENGKDSVKAVHSTVETNNPYSSTDLTKDITDQIISYHAVGANVVAIKAQNSLEETILDMYA